MSIVAPLFRLALSLGMAAGLVAFADPALASTTTVDGRAQTSISVADLDLHSAAGRATATRRIRAAAQTVCQDAGDRFATARCIGHAMGGAQLAASETPTQLAAR